MEAKPRIKVVKAPHTWKCDRCGAVIKQGEECLKIGKEKVCSKHVKEKGGEAVV